MAPDLDDTRSVLTADGTYAGSLYSYGGSTLTLAPSGTAPAAVLVFSADNSVRATLFLAGAPVYRFASNATGTKTELISVGLDGAEERLVTYDRRLLGAVLVRPDGGRLKVARYLRPLKTKPEGCALPRRALRAREC
jgi:hypothetical protein